MTKVAQGSLLVCVVWFLDVLVNICVHDSHRGDKKLRVAKGCLSHLINVNQPQYFEMPEVLTEVVLLSH